jgi:hypothetical protein
MQRENKEIFVSLISVLLIYIARGVYIYFNEDVNALQALIIAASELGFLILVILIAVVGVLIFWAIKQMFLKNKKQ